MKTKILKFVTILFVSVCGFSSCEDNILFTEYSSLEFDCDWYDYRKHDWSNFDKVIIINSYKELKKHIECPNSYPNIDFSIHTLLLAKGITGNSCYGTVKSFQQTSKNKYMLYVEVTLGDATAVDSWGVALITNKLSKGSNVGLSVETKR